MATYTTNLNLKKPAQSDKIRIADINNNMDDIDAAFGAVGNDSVATQLGDIQDAIAIVATGNAHAAITSGQYVYVKGHDTLDTGLYKATSNISQNGTLSSSNLAADTAGGLNALSGQIATLGGKFVLVNLNTTTNPAGSFTYNYSASQYILLGVVFDQNAHLESIDTYNGVIWIATNVNSTALTGKMLYYKFA